jgi:hypothetical protein
VLVFWRNAGFAGGRGEWLGVAAIVAGTFCYCLGAVLSRPLLQTLAPLQLTTAQAIVGGVALAALSAQSRRYGADLSRPADAEADRRAARGRPARHHRRPLDLPAPAARLGRVSRRPLCVRLAGGRARRRRDRARRSTSAGASSPARRRCSAAPRWRCAGRDGTVALAEAR